MNRAKLALAAKPGDAEAEIINLISRSQEGNEYEQNNLEP